MIKKIITLKPGCKLWTNDCWWLDVYQPSKDCPWNLFYNLKCWKAKLGLKNDENLSGRLFVSSGLGGMSGAQGKAAEIAGGVGLIAEVDYSRIKTRYEQGWIKYIEKTPEAAIKKAQEYLEKKEATSIAYYGNIVDF